MPAAATVGRERLAAAGYLDPGSGRPLLLEQLRPIGRALMAQAFAPDAGRRDRLILVSSAVAGEGKSFTAVNLALVLTQDDRQAVLLVDGDPRTAGSARALGLLPEPRLSDALQDAALDPLVSPTGLDGLCFLAPGRPWAGMTRALASRPMAQLVGELLAREPRGLVVVDAPPARGHRRGGAGDVRGPGGLGGGGGANLGAGDRRHPGAPGRAGQGPLRAQSDQRAEPGPEGRSAPAADG